MRVRVRVRVRVRAVLSVVAVSAISYAGCCCREPRVSKILAKRLLAHLIVVSARDVARLRRRRRRRG